MPKSLRGAVTHEGLQPSTNILKGALIRVGFLSIFATNSMLDASAVTDALYIAARPRRHQVLGMRDLRIDLVVSMIWFRPAPELTRAPFKLVRLPTIDSPLFPIPLRMLRQVPPPIT